MRFLDRLLELPLRQRERLLQLVRAPLLALGLLARGQQRALQLMDALLLRLQVLGLFVPMPQSRDAVLELLQLVAQPCRQGVARHQLAAQAQAFGLRGFELACPLRQQARAAGLRLRQLAREDRVLVLQFVEPLQVRAIRGADLVLEHVDVAQDLLLQRGVAARMRQRTPQRAADIVALLRGMPPARQRLRGLVLRRLPQRDREALVQLLLQHLRHRPAPRALVDRAAVHLVVVAQGLTAEQLAQLAAQHRHRQAHADHRAQGLRRQFPQASTARAARHRRVLGIRRRGRRGALAACQRLRER